MKKSPPKHLSKEIQKWFRQVVKSFKLAEHHMLLLYMACETWDRWDGAREEVLEKGITIKDRFGQDKRNPACDVEQKARIDFNRMVRELGLPEPDDEDDEE